MSQKDFKRKLEDLAAVELFKWLRDRGRTIDELHEWLQACAGLENRPFDRLRTGTGLSSSYPYPARSGAPR